MQVSGTHTQACDRTSGCDVLRERALQSGGQWIESEAGGEQRGGRLHLQPQKQLLERKTTEYVSISLKIQSSFQFKALLA